VNRPASYPLPPVEATVPAAVMTDDGRGFSISVFIQAPVERVWPIMRDGERWHEWTPSVTRIVLLDAPLRLGSRARIHQPKLPPALWRVTRLDEGRGFTWVSTGPGIRVTADHSVEPRASGTQATLSIRYEGWLAGVLAVVTRGINLRYLHLEATGLKARAEGKTTRGIRTP
jgi:uncharacterized protein YndB with AHSA1/START domain